MPFSTKHSLFRSALPFVIFFLFSSLASAQIADWVAYSPNARNIGMGGAAGASPDAYDAVDINPAEIGVLGGTNFSFSQGILGSNLLSEHLVYDQKLGNGDGFALGGDYFDYTNVPGYNPYSLNVYGGYGLRLMDSLRFGLAAHFIYDNYQIVPADQSGAIDAGVYFHGFRSPLSISAALSDLGWNINGASLPTQVRAAWAYQVNLDDKPYIEPTLNNSRLILAGQGNWSLVNSTSSTFDLGAEGWINGVFALRAGYQFANFANAAAPLGISAGAGARLDDWQIDYAFTTMGDFSTSHQISLSLMFGGNEKTPTPQQTVMTTPEATPVITETPVATEAPTEVATEVTPEVTEVPADTNVPEAARPMWHQFRKSMSAYQAHDYQGAAQGLKEAIDTPGSAKWRYAESYAMLGVIAEYYDHSKGHLAKAKAYYLKALKLDSKNATARKHIQRWQ